MANKPYPIEDTGPRSMLMLLDLWSKQGTPPDLQLIREYARITGLYLRGCEGTAAAPFSAFFVANFSEDPYQK